MYTKVRKILPEESEINYLMKTWGREERKRHPVAFPDRLFYPSFGKVMVEVAKRSQCLVACNPDDINQIQGFAIGLPPKDGVFVLHFVYVRPEFRQMGLCREMCAAMGYDASQHELVATHWSKDAEKIDRKGRPIVHLPWALYLPYGVTL